MKLGCPLVRQAGAGSPAVGGLSIGGAGEIERAARCNSTSLVTAATELPTLSMTAFSESAEIASRRVQARTWVGSARLILLRMGGCLMRCMAAFPGCGSTACKGLRSIFACARLPSRKEPPERRCLIQPARSQKARQAGSLTRQSTGKRRALFSSSQPDAGFRTTGGTDIQTESHSMLRIGRLGELVHSLTGSRDQQPIEISADEDRAARLRCRHPNGAGAVAFRRVDIDT